MGGKCRMHEKDEKCTGYLSLVGYPKGKRPLGGNTCIDEKINVYSESIKDEEFLDELSDYQILFLRGTGYSLTCYGLHKTESSLCRSLFFFFVLTCSYQNFFHSVPLSCTVIYKICYW
jgi:hypothetical protein